MNDFALDVYPGLLRKARYRTIHDRSLEPEDLVQEAYVRWLDRDQPATFESEGRAYAYLANMMTWRATDTDRNLTRTCLTLLDTAPAAHLPDLADRAIAAVTLEAILASVAEDERAALALLTALGYSGREIADAAHRHPKTVNTELHYWRKDQRKPRHSHRTPREYAFSAERVA